MLPGPTITRRCRRCRQHFGQRTLRSGNNLGAQCWTDGYCRAPMLPFLPWFIECPHCGTPAWTDQLPKVEDHPDAYSLPVGRMPSPQRHREALGHRRLTRARQRYLRQILWWYGNDARRGVADPVPLADGERENLEALASLLDRRSDEDRVILAEILRELGRFAEAREWLAVPREDDEFDRFAACVQALAEAGDPWVRKW